LRDSATIGVEQNSPMSTPGVAKLAASGDREIAARDQLAAGGGRYALHGGDHGFRQMHDRLHHRAAGIHHLRKVGAAAVGIAAPRRQFLHVMARGEGRAIGRDHRRARCCRRGSRSARVQLGDQAFGEAVARAGPVEREHGDAADLSRGAGSGCGALARAVWAGIGNPFARRAAILLKSAANCAVWQENGRSRIGIQGFHFSCLSVSAVTLASMNA
jgi:hypothetical protein